MIYPVEYIANVYDEVEIKNDIVHGVTFAENYAEAMKNIETYYGDNIIDVKLFMLEESSVYEFEMNSKEGMFNIKIKRQKKQLSSS